MKSFLYAFSALALVLGAGSTSAQAEVTARDLRTQTTTRWDYQPGQGPKRMARERDFFSPGLDTESEKIPPRPPVKTGDWRNNPPRAEERVPQPPASNILVTQTGIDLGAEVSNYEYRERELDVTIKGPRYGFTLDGTYAWNSRWFVRGETRANYGSLDYEGSGEKDGVDDFVFEARGTVGRDWTFGRYAISPYLGVGYRYLFNDLDGTTSTGAEGYKRISHYLFIPVGVQPRFSLGNGGVLSLRAEFDPIVHGWQQSQFSDISASRPDITNDQTFGYGIRGDLMYQQSRWSVGPYANYWNLGRSSYDCETAGITVCSYEPHNHTVEYGLRVKYRLY